MQRGATFTVQLPLMTIAGPGPATRDGTNPPVAVPAPAAEAERRFAVLLVEDHEPSRIALARLLANRKIDVVQAASAAEARAKADGRSFDLVISDIGLPDRDGYALMSELRERHGCRGIALSGYGMEADIRRSREAGFMAHLTKPVKIQALDQALQQACR